MIRRILSTIIVVAACLAMANSVLADKVFLNDGRVLEGVIIEEGTGYIIIRTTVGSLTREQLIATATIERIERDSKEPPKQEPARGEPRTDPKPVNENARQQPAQQQRITEERDVRQPVEGRPTRVAILNFGPPVAWGKSVGSMVGVHISHVAFENAVPMLVEDEVDVVVIRINSGGGAGSEIEPMQILFNDVYERKFRTVAWVEYAGSAAAMGPYSIDDFYFMPQGALGGCVGWFGGGTAVSGWVLEDMLYTMERASAMGNRDPIIMRAMQVDDVPLSVDIDPDTGKVSWRPDFDGQIKINPPGNVLTINSQQALETGFAKGIAATREELMEVMGITEYVWAGERATRYIDDFMRNATRTEQRLNEVFTKYQDALALAEAMPAGPERPREAGRARRFLSQIRTWIRQNPNFEFMYGINADWFEAQERIIRRLMQ